jgi:endoribonuclease LACTB2
VLAEPPPTLVMDTLQGWQNRWLSFECFLSPRVAWAFEQLQNPDSVSSGAHVNRLSEVIPGVRQLPLKSPTLPPAAHTNAYVIGDERLIVVDPATFEAQERGKLERVLRDLMAQGMQIEAIVLTHHHFDHYGAAQWASNTFHAPIWAHAQTQELLKDELTFSRSLAENDRIDLGRDRAGRPFELEVRFTPGHAPGHIVLCDLRPGSKAMIVGDMVAAVGTIIVDPDEGDMSRYIAELGRLLRLGPRCVFPAHGPPIGNGPAKLRQYIKHRLTREKMVLAALTERGPAKAAELLDLAYADTPSSLYPLAERSCLAHLIKLVGDGRAQQVDALFEAV